MEHWAGLEGVGGSRRKQLFFLLFSSVSVLIDDSPLGGGQFPMGGSCLGGDVSLQLMLAGALAI